MTFTSPETPEAGKKTTEQVQQQTREELAKAKADLLKRMSAPELIKGFFKDFPHLNSTERWQYLSAIVVTLLFKKENAQQQTEGGEAGTEGVLAEEEAPEPAPTKDEKPKTNEPDKKDSSEPNKPKTGWLPNFDVTKFRSGSDIFKSFKEHLGGIDVQEKFVPLKTVILKERPGAPEWTRKSTGGWDWEKAGNTEEKMKQGIYNIEATEAPAGYTRGGVDNVPPETASKLSKIAMALLNDTRMPLFTGIAMTVDGVEVMMVKEIHMHQRGSASTYLCQPHTGVSFIMKKT